jgi:hypothetical protein
MQSVFENEHIHGARRFISEYQFFVGELPQMVAVRRVSTTLRHIRSEFIEFCFLSLAVC